MHALRDWIVLVREAGLDVTCGAHTGIHLCASHTQHNTLPSLNTLPNPSRPLDAPPQRPPTCAARPMLRLLWCWAGSCLRPRGAAAAALAGRVVHLRAWEGRHVCRWVARTMAAADL